MGMRLAWATDIHLDFLADEQVRAFAGALVADRPDAVILSGDLSHAEQLEHHLRLLAGATSCPIYFVLGNHDYGGDGAGWEFGKGAFEIIATVDYMFAFAATTGAVARLSARPSNRPPATPPSQFAPVLGAVLCGLSGADKGR